MSGDDHHAAHGFNFKWIFRETFCPKALNRKVRKEMTQRTQRGSGFLCGLRESFAAVAVKSFTPLLESPVLPPA
jgi:hypothetical protein